MKNQNLKFNATVIFIACIILTSCGNLIEKNEITKAIVDGNKDNITNQPKISEKKCDRRQYETPNDNSTCYKLQEKLVISASQGDIEGITLALKNGANVHASYSEHYPALYVAISSGKENAVKLLIDNGAEVNMDFNFGITPLKLAVSRRHLNIAVLLIKNGADICLAPLDDNGKEKTALDIAKDKGYNEIESALIQLGADKCM